MTSILTYKIDFDACEVNRWNTLNIYSDDKLIARRPLSEADPLGNLKVLLEGEYKGTLTANYSTTNSLVSPISEIREVLQTEKIQTETLSGSLDDIRKSLTGDRKSSKTPIP